MAEVLVTGGAGFVGSHTVLQLIEAGYEPVIADLFTNSSLVAIERLQNVAGVFHPRIFEENATLFF